MRSADSVCAQRSSATQADRCRTTSSGRSGRGAGWRARWRARSAAVPLGAGSDRAPDGRRRVDLDTHAGHVDPRSREPLAGTTGATSRHHRSAVRGATRRRTGRGLERRGARRSGTSITNRGARMDDFIPALLACWGRRSGVLRGPVLHHPAVRHPPEAGAATPTDAAVGHVVAEWNRTHPTAPRRVEPGRPPGGSSCVDG